VLPDDRVDATTTTTAKSGAPLLRRSKSRSDLDALKEVRYGRGRAARNRAKATVDPVSFKDELDFAGWYGEFEDQLEDKNNDEYRYGAFTGDMWGITIDVP
jgi:hypothetical protein